MFNFDFSVISDFFFFFRLPSTFPNMCDLYVIFCVNCIHTILVSRMHSRRHNNVSKQVCSVFREVNMDVRAEAHLAIFLKNKTQSFIDG